MQKNKTERRSCDSLYFEMEYFEHTIASCDNDYEKDHIPV